MAGPQLVKRKTARLKNARQSAFLKAYAKCGVITRAAVMAKTQRRAHYTWMEEDPDYPELFREAHEQAVDVLETEAVRRAVDGYEKPVWHDGVQVGTERKYSDTLLIFLMKGNKPEKYRDNVYHQHAHAHLHKRSGDSVAALRDDIKGILTRAGGDATTISDVGAGGKLEGGKLVGKLVGGKLEGNYDEGNVEGTLDEGNVDEGNVDEGNYDEGTLVEGTLAD